MAINKPGFDFASRDYENIKRDLLARAAQVTPEWTDRDSSDFGVLMVDLWAYMGDVIHYYIDRAAGEAFVTTATQRESLLALANLFDYVPYSRRAATATVTVANASSEIVVLPANTVFIGISESTNLNFFSIEDVSVPANGTAQVQVTEGIKIEEEVLVNASSGRANQRYSLSKLNAVASSVEIYVYEDGINATPWNRVVDIALTSTKGSAYSVSVNADNETQVIFGSGLSGRIPPNNSKITATYSVTSGAEGNIPANKITSFKNYQPNGLTVISSGAASGGSSGESIDSIKSSLKATIKSQDRAVTLNDFVDLALRIPGVYLATAVYQPSITGGGSVTIYGMPYISDYQTYTGNTASVYPEVQEQIELSIQPMAMLGVTVVPATSITLVQKNISGTVFVEESYVRSSVLRTVEDALNGLFELGSLEFGEDLQLGDVYKTIHDIEGVLYASNIVITGSTPTETQLIRKGQFTITGNGGITTSV